MRKRAILRYTQEDLATALSLPSGLRVLCAANVTATGDILITIEGDQLSVVRSGEELPTIPLSLLGH